MPVIRFEVPLAVVPANTASAVDEFGEVPDDQLAPVAHTVPLVVVHVVACANAAVGAARSTAAIPRMSPHR
jgi:hypothetical protein